MQLRVGSFSLRALVHTPNRFKCSDILILIVLVQVTVECSSLHLLLCSSLYFDWLLNFPVRSSLASSHQLVVRLSSFVQHSSIDLKFSIKGIILSVANLSSV